MNFRVSQRWPLLLPRHNHFLGRQNRLPSASYIISKSLSRSFHATRSSFNGANSSSNTSQGNIFLVPGATIATIVMLGVLHARRIYNDKKVEEMKEKGIELEFLPDVKAKFLRVLPLRTISRTWGFLSSLEIPVWLRPSIYKAWARAFHSDLEEVAMPLDHYASLQEFFIHALKEGSRPIDPDANCLVSPVDGTILRFGELRGAGALIEQVKGFSYSAFSLLGASSSLHDVVNTDMHVQDPEQIIPEESSKRSWWRVSLASPKARNPVSRSPMKGVFYCVLYLKPGDYHRVHSPSDWQVFIRRHFTGRLFPVNERATRTIKSLHIENERVVLEGNWREGFMAIAAIGATNIGSIKLFIEPELRTNRPKWRLLHSEPPEERIYEPQGVGVMLKKGEEVAAFNLGSTVVLIFQAPISRLPGKDGFCSDFKFCVENGDRIKVGQAIGRCSSS